MAPKTQRKGIRAALTETYNTLKSQSENNCEVTPLYNLYRISMKSCESHEKRVVEMINEIEKEKYNLNLNERKALSNFLETYGFNVVKNSKRIKNSGNVASVTNSLYNFLHQEIENPNLKIHEISRPKSLTERAANVIRPDFAKYSETRQKTGVLARTGHAYIPDMNKAFSWVKKNAVAIGAAIIFGLGGLAVGGYLGRESQEPKILEQQTKINCYEGQKAAYIEVIEILANKNEEVRKEAAEETTAKYEKIIENVKQEARNQYDRLLEQQQNTTRVAKPKTLEQKTEEANTLIIQNTIEENRMATLKDVDSVGIKPEYMRDGFWTYANDFGKENDKNFKKGPLEAVLGCAGIVYQGIIVLNKTAETILTPPAEIVGAGLGAIAYVSGLNCNATLERGALDGKTFVKRVGANTWGGRNLTGADWYLMGGAADVLFLNFDDAGKKIGRGIAIPTEFEEGFGNKATAETVYIISHILPFLDWGGDSHGHHHGSGGIDRGGGRLGGGDNISIIGGRLR